PQLPTPNSQLPSSLPMLPLRRLSQNLQQRTLICTFVALTSGLFWSFVGGQISVNARTQKCTPLFWPLRTACKAVVTPVAFWQGSTTGLWTGAILGAFIAGLATAKPQEEASELKLTPEQRQEAERLLLELLANLDRLENREDTLLQALQRQHQQLPGEKTLTEADIHKLLLALQTQPTATILRLPSANPTPVPPEQG
ncbi:hypothetical protein QM565_31440, partial [Geitlerinema splendidum]|nr:hypothetical protein [Geitlerinema splendidum]